MSSTREFKHASTVEGVRFTAQVGLPNVLQGVFKRRPMLTRVASTVGADHQAYRLVAGLVRKYGPEPFFVKLAKDDVLLLTRPEDIRAVLEGSPDPFAPDPDAKRKGMQAFQPDALTISRGDLWKNRRAFAESVLDTGKPLHRLAETFLTVVAEEALAVGTTITWPQLNDLVRRITRRVIFGDDAADDTGLSEQLAKLMDAGNKMPGKPAAGYDEFIARIEAYLRKPGEGSLASLVKGAPSNSNTKVAGQLVHWMFAMGDTLPANVMRALALLATHSFQLAEVRAELASASLLEPKSVADLNYTTACLLEAMRLWPTTTMLARVTTRDVTIGAASVPADTQVVIFNTFNHRNRDRFDFADRFAPDEWTTGTAGDDWSFNFFSNGAQGCPGAGLALFLGTALIAQLVTAATPELRGASLEPHQPLPHALDIFPMTIAFGDYLGAMSSSAMPSGSRNSRM